MCTRSTTNSLSPVCPPFVALVFRAFILCSGPKKATHSSSASTSRPAPSEVFVSVFSFAAATATQCVPIRNFLEFEKTYSISSPLWQCGSTDSSRLMEKTKVGIGAYFHRSKDDDEMLQVKVACLLDSDFPFNAIRLSRACVPSKPYPRQATNMNT